MKKLKEKKGFVLLFTVLLAAVVLAVSLEAANVAFREIGFSTSARDTNEAFFAADTGVECALYNDKAGDVSFVQTGGSGSINCMGSAIPVSGSYPIWNFIVSGLGESGNGCSRVSVDKSNLPIVALTSYGYNEGGSSCNSTAANLVERELEVTFNEPSNPNLNGCDTVTASGGYTMHTFTCSGTFTPPNGVSKVTYLIVGGGGGGGGGGPSLSSGGGGGGGAGGLLHGTSSVYQQTYQIVVGSGGGGGAIGNAGLNGGDSSFNSLIVKGGGGGGTFHINGLSGGSGGGGGYSASGGQGIVHQGYDGGTSSYYYAAGGGGGASEIGYNAEFVPPYQVGGNGGTGYQSSISGSKVSYAGGGGGGTGFGTSSGGGAGGGGSGGANYSGGPVSPGDGTPNSGGGGGGGGTGAGASGGSGVVILQYKTP